jgi:hypothetical protein
MVVLSNGVSYTISLCELFLVAKETVESPVHNTQTAEFESYIKAWFALQTKKDAKEEWVTASFIASELLHQPKRQFHQSEFCHLVTLRCIICSMLNFVFSLKPLSHSEHIMLQT